MPVYFAYRSFDLGPTGKYLKRFEDDTVLDWFQNHWEYLAIEDREQAAERLAEVLGCDGCFLWNPFRRAAAQGLPPPDSDEALMGLFRRCFRECDFFGSQHALQVYSEEDGQGGALYYFDGHFLKQSGGLAAYLLHEDWRLPSGLGDGLFVPSVWTNSQTPGGSGSGATHVVFLEMKSKYPLGYLQGGYRIEGLRLPELARHLCCLPPDTEDRHWGWHGHLRCLPALLLGGVEAADPSETGFLRAVQKAPGEAVNWAAWSDWREERGGVPPGIGLLRDALERLARFPGRLQDELPRDADLDTACRQLIEMESQHQSDLRTTHHSLLHVEDHLVQTCLDESWTDNPCYGQWIFFDDLWASAHTDLANAILRFAARWDVLFAD